MANAPRTAEDLERKYDFASLLGIKKNVQMNEKSLTKVENELANMLNTLIINLRDVLDSQGDISLWFFSGTPTTSDEPYISWTNPSEHYGDIYYDEATGYVYQYYSSGWVLNTDTNLIQAMALTNVEIDTLEDHERKVYFTQPTPPYSSGDWWILEDGTLKICQLSRTSGTYENDDFIIANRYTPTIASADGDIITIKKGQVIKMSDTFATFEDLATGGKTIINGANITTGTINTDNVTIGNGNVTMDEDGLKLKNGAKVVGENGLMNTYIYTSETFDTCGYMMEDPSGWDPSQGVYKKGVKIDIDIPEGLNITSAKIEIFHAPTHWTQTDIYGTDHYYWGYSRGIRAYKATNLYSRKVEAVMGSEYYETNDTTYQEISGAFGTNGWTPTAPNDTTHNTERKTSIDIKSSLTSGLNEILIQPGENSSTSWSSQTVCERTAFIYAIIKIDGYMSY